MQSRSFSLLASVSLIALSTLTGCSSMPGWMGGDASSTGKTTTNMEALLNKSYKEAIERAESAYQDGKKDDAIALYMRAAEYAPQEVYPLLQTSDILWEMHNTPEVISVLEHARVVSPDNVDVIRNLGRAYVSAGSLKKAQDTYMAALAIAPADIRVLNGLGLAYDLDSKHDVAQKHYRAGLELEPTDADLQNNLAFSLISSGQFDEAAKILEPLVSSSSATARQRQNLALAYGMLGREDDVARVASADLSPAEIKRNLVVYAHLRSEAEHGKILNDFGKPNFKNGSLSNKPTKPLPKHVGDELKQDAKAPEHVEAPKADPAKVVAPKVEEPVVLTDIKSADIKPVDETKETSVKADGIKLEEASKADTVKAPNGEQPLASASISAPTGMSPIISGPTAVGARKEKGEKAVSSLDNGTQILTAKVDDVVKAPAKSSKKADTSTKAADPVKAEAMINKTSEPAKSAAAKSESTDVKKPVAKLVDEKVVDVPRVAPIEAKAAAEKAKKDAAKKAAADKKAPSPVTSAKPEHVLPTPPVASAPEKVEVKATTDKAAAPDVAANKAVETPLAAASAEPVTSVTPPETVKSPAPAPAETKQTPAIAPALGTGKVFLGTFDTESEARVAWIRVWSAHSAALGTMVASIEPKDGKQSLYAVGAANKDDALKICAQLKDAGVECAAN